MKQFFLDRFIAPIRRRCDKDISFKSGNYFITLPGKSTLPEYFKEFPLYDKFLPVLAANINVQGTIIDIGANTGDTLVSMIQNCKNNFICVEPSEFFNKYLHKNIAALTPEDAARVKTIKAMIGTGAFAGKLVGNESTAHLSVLQDAEKGVALDTVVGNHKEIVLLKSDTDGFDFDVIFSSEKILEQSEPVIFFENQIDEEFQLEGFNRLYDFLFSKGYSYIYLFDNYGNLICEKSDYHTLRNINSYLFSMKKFNKTKTFHYIDVLVSTGKYENIVKNAVYDYKKNWISVL